MWSVHLVWVILLMWGAKESALSRVVERLFTWEEVGTGEPSNDKVNSQVLESVAFELMRRTSLLFPLSLRRLIGIQLLIACR